MITELQPVTEPWTVNDVVQSLPASDVIELTQPEYLPVKTRAGDNIALAVETMQRHMTDEGWQIMEGLGQAGYRLCGTGLELEEMDVTKIVMNHRPKTLVIQDRREWLRKGETSFVNSEGLQEKRTIFKVTILKDAHHDIQTNRHWCWQVGIHAWIVYYNPKIVNRLAPYTRQQHLIRTYHTVRKEHLPAFKPARLRRTAMLSGAVSNAYPWRQYLTDCKSLEATKFKHPGYHLNGKCCATPEYLQTLNNFKVSICTASMYGYALRKIIESVACGCLVITDLPYDEQLPLIEPSIVRVRPGTPVEVVNDLIHKLSVGYSEDRQRVQAREAAAFYDHVGMTARLAQDIETLRRNYCQ